MTRRSASGRDRDMFASAPTNVPLLTDRKSPSHLLSPGTPGHDAWTRRTNQKGGRRREKINRASKGLRLPFAALEAQRTLVLKLGRALSARSVHGRCTGGAREAAGSPAVPVPAGQHHLQTP